jgi:predicted dehydrogenase
VDSVHGKGDVQFVVGQTRTRSRAEDFCRARDIRLVDDYAAVLADPAVDAVVLATPHSQHGEQVRQAAAAGKHVFCEKPFTLSAADAQSAVAAAQRAGIVLAVGFNRRFHPSMQALAQHVRDGSLGPIAGVLGQHTSYSSPAMTPEGWRASADESPAGAMTAIGVHTLDCMIALFGRVAEVYCATARSAVDYAEDTTNVIVKFANGVTGNIFCSISSAPHYSFKVFGLNGIAEISRPHLEQFAFHPSPPRPRLPGGPSQIVTTEKFDTLHAELTAFADAVAGKAPFPVPLDDVVMGVKAFEAVVRSAQEDRPVAVG